MQIEDLMTRRVGTCRPTQTLSSAAQVMWELDCGCVPVVDENERVVGMLTDRDICMAMHFRGVPQSMLRVGEVMSRPVRAIWHVETPADAAAVMRDAAVRRLPVVDERQRLVGLISLADLARAAHQHGSGRVGVSADEIGETLRAVCAKATPAQVAPPAPTGDRRSGDRGRKTTAPPAV